MIVKLLTPRHLEPENNNVCCWKYFAPAKRGDSWDTWGNSNKFGLKFNGVHDVIEPIFLIVITMSTSLKF